MPPAESEPFVGKARCWLRGRECVLGGDSLLKHHSLPQKGPVPERGSLGNAWVVESSLLLGTLGALGGLIGSSLVGGSVSASLVGGRRVGSGLID